MGSEPKPGNFFIMSKLWEHMTDYPVISSARLDETFQKCGPYIVSRALPRPPAPQHIPAEPRHTTLMSQHSAASLATVCTKRQYTKISSNCLPRVDSSLHKNYCTKNNKFHGGHINMLAWRGTRGAATVCLVQGVPPRRHRHQDNGLRRILKCLLS